MPGCRSAADQYRPRFDHTQGLRTPWDGDRARDVAPRTAVDAELRGIGGVDARSHATRLHVLVSDLQVGVRRTGRGRPVRLAVAEAPPERCGPDPQLHPTAQ